MTPILPSTDTASPEGARPSLVTLAGRGALVSFGFSVAMQLLFSVQGIVLARMLGPAVLGLYAIAVAVVGIAGALKNTAIAQKLVQERDVDLFTAYRVALTLELLLSSACAGVLLVASPILAAVYHRPQLWPVTSALAASLLATLLVELPVALLYRQMRFARRATLLAVAPVSGAATSLVAAYLGAGIWSLVAGDLTGLAVAAAVVGFAAPMRPGLCLDRRVLRRYLSFGWPYWGSGMLSAAAGWGAIAAVSATMGISVVAFFELALAWSRQVLKVDTALADAAYPALCARPAASDSTIRAFSLTNRISMLFAAPAGLGLAVLSGPAVAVLLGPPWMPAVPLVAAAAIAVTLDALGHNWHVFLASRGITWPRLVTTALAVAWTGLVLVPALVTFGIIGASAAIAGMGAVSLVVRQHFVRRFVGPVNLVHMVRRETFAAAIAAGILLAARILGWDPGGAVGLVEQGAFYLAIFGATALLVSRDLIALAISILRVPPQPISATPPQPSPSRTPTGVAWRRELELTARMTTPEPMAFPLLVAADQAGGAMWVTTRDWPALGRLDLATGTWRWTRLPAFPHAPTPDGYGGCWSALTRSSALAHVGADGNAYLVRLPRTRELLVTAISAERLFAVDADRKLLWSLPAIRPEAPHNLPGAPEPTEPLALVLPEEMVRPDFAVRAIGGEVWVGDTQSAVIAVFELGMSGVPRASGAAGAAPEASLRTLAGPHPCRAMVADERRGGVWLGASERNALSLVDPAGRVLSSMELPSTPFGIALLADGRLAAALRESDAVVLADPELGKLEMLDLPDGSAPLGCAAGVVPGIHAGEERAQGSVYVTLSGRSEIAVLATPPPCSAGEHGSLRRPGAIQPPVAPLRPPHQASAHLR